VVDDQNRRLFELLDLWARRDRRFDDESQGRFLEKGILLSGNVGTGKTDALKLLNQYLTYLNSRIRFQVAIVWRFAEVYKSDGFAAFNHLVTGNFLMDELALTDEATGQLISENVNHFGSKIVVGERLIMRRYASFGYGWHTHFTTNCQPKVLKELYGERAFSRLTQMCNFLSLTGPDRRKTSRPHFRKNLNETSEDSPSIVPPLPPAVLAMREQEALDTKARLNEHYQNWLVSGNLWEFAPFDYALFVHYGADIVQGGMMENIYLQLVATDVRKARAEVDAELALKEAQKDWGEDQRRAHIKNSGRLHNPTWLTQQQSIVDQYTTGNIPSEEKNKLLHESRRVAVRGLFEALKSAGSTQVFPHPSQAHSPGDAERREVQVSPFG
jgi:hypothetical protein